MSAAAARFSRRSSSGSTVTGLGAGPDLGSESTPTGATLPQPRAVRKRPRPSPHDAPSAAADSNASNSTGASSSDRLHGDGGREHVEPADVDQDQQPMIDEPTGPQDHVAGTADAPSTADGSFAALAAPAMAKRASLMFSVTATAPAASGLPRAARKATKELVQLAFTATNNLCDQHGSKLCASFGNFDRVVGLGWLLGDALGLPLVDHKCAHAVGLKARRIAGEVKTGLSAKEKQARKDAAKLEADDPKRLEIAKAVESAKTTLLREDVSLPLQLPLPAAPPAKASGSRKCACVREPTLEDRWDAATLARLSARKVVDKELSKQEAAEAAIWARAKVFERMCKKKEAAASQAKGSSQKKQLQHWRTMVRQSHVKLEDAILAERNAEIAVLHARIAFRDAMLDELELNIDVLTSGIEDDP